LGAAELNAAGELVRDAREEAVVAEAELQTASTVANSVTATAEARNLGGRSRAVISGL
jgi:hypothetical protein